MLNQYNQIRRGDIYFCDLGEGYGCEQGNYRPVLICQCRAGNEFSRTTVIVPLSSSKTKKSLPTHVHIEANDKLSLDSVILCEQIRVIDKSRLRRFVTYLSKTKMSEVDEAITIGLGLNEPKGGQQNGYNIGYTH
jgi:mRNA interferase MazF